MNPAQFIREGFVEIREHIGRTVLQTLGVILGVASVVATLGMTASMTRGGVSISASRVVHA